MGHPAAPRYGENRAARRRSLIYAIDHRIEPDFAATTGKYGGGNARPRLGQPPGVLAMRRPGHQLCPHRGTAVGPIDSPNADCARRSRARLFGGLYRRGSEPAEIVSAAAPGRAPWWRRRFRETSSTSDGECGDGQSPRPTAPCDGTCRADSPIASIVSTLRSFSEL